MVRFLGRVTIRTSRDTTFSFRTLITPSGQLFDPSIKFEDFRERTREILDSDGTISHVVLTDIFGATPCNVCQLLVEGTRIPLLSGASLPMLMRAVTYQDQALETVVLRALEGGTKGVMRVGSVLRTAA